MRNGGARLTGRWRPVRPEIGVSGCWSRGRVLTECAHNASRAEASDSFFFSSRRRHTRCSRDWSSDVCSSDLSLGDLSLSSERKLASSTAAAGSSTGSEWKNQGVLNLVKSPYAKLRNVPVHAVTVTSGFWAARRDPKSTRLNSSHGYISYAVFCLKKKKAK